MDDEELPEEDRTTAMQTAIDDFALVMGQLVHESRSAALSQPSYLTVPPDPPLHRLAWREHVVVANELGGTVNSLAVQAHSVDGGIHVHHHAQVRPVAPWQMPVVSSRFVNRSQELAALDELLLGTERRCSGVLLSGPAGVGKSAVARSWLWLRRDHFPDGILYADLRGEDDAVAVYRVLCSLLAALDVAPERMPASVDACTALFRSLTATRRIQPTPGGSALHTLYLWILP